MDLARSQIQIAERLLLLGRAATSLSDLFSIKSYVNTEFKRANQNSGREVCCTSNSLASLILKSVHKLKIRMKSYSSFLSINSRTST